ncbi:hypothetical protein AB835_08980 [Candidatus Endobugula sertula]|uniref:DUF2288 domain-containing protein n=1 Tax=Candidatus Endobugula sertula TaxID=62101 RepID=A0A1D2QPA4_9GAMM|nr:hypothetical protein AB835_08980 [Candidatus Endobugula sertula]
MTIDNDDTLSIHDKINRETARIPWAELATHFAAGHLITVSSELDLIDVAQALAKDNTAHFQAWIGSGQVMSTSDSQAIEWQADNKELWAVVIKPWILVQPVK